jgi:hypothetical protein
VAESRGEDECADVNVGVKMEGRMTLGTTTPASRVATKKASSDRVQPFVVPLVARFLAHAPAPVTLVLSSLWDVTDRVGMGLYVLSSSTQVARARVGKRKVCLTAVCVACDGCTW